MKTNYESAYKKLEQRRGFFFRIGLSVSLLLTFIAFEWETSVPRFEFTEQVSFIDEIETLAPVTWLREETKPILIDKHKSPVINNSPFVVVPDEIIINDPESDSILIADVIPIEFKPEVDTITEDFLLVPEVNPEFPGSDRALVKYLQNHIQYPEKERAAGISGTVYLSFIINDLGKVVAIECLRSPGEAFTIEATRVLKNMPRWKPGMQGGKAVNVKMSIPVNFKLL